jgi:hypothetical protein
MPILGFSAWAACAAFPMLGQPRAEIVHAVPMEQPAAALTVAPAVMAQNAPPAVRREKEAAAVSPPAIADPHELVGPAVEVVSTPRERSSALALLGRARQRALRHVPGTPPYRFTVSFQAAGACARASVWKPS